MTVFRILSFLSIAGLLSAMAFSLRRRYGSWPAVRTSFREQISGAAQFVGKEARFRKGVSRTVLRRTVYILALVFALALALSAFLPVLVTGDHLTGVFLVIHVTVAPLFALSLAVAALLWAEEMRLRPEDWKAARRRFRKRGSAGEDFSPTLRRAGFWLVLIVSLPLMLSIVLGMYPLFGTDGEEFLISLHGYSALLLTVIALVIVYGGMSVSETSQVHPPKEE